MNGPGKPTAHRVHRIRLPDPWQTLPTRTERLDSGELETVCEFQRSFQQPSGLTDQSCIELEVVIEADTGRLQRVECLVNDQSLSSLDCNAGRVKFLVGRDRMQATNRVNVRIAWLGEPSEVIRPQVALILS